MSRSARWVPAVRLATCRPASPHASAASTPPPRVLDTTATLCPWGTGCEASRAAVSSSSPRLAAAITPACSSRACLVRGGVTAAAARAAARRRPAADRPTFTVRTGLLRPRRRAVRANLRGFPNDSRYSTASLVAVSDSHHSSMSLPETSSLSPSETNEEIPMPSRDRCSSSTTPTPPDCSARPALPGSGWRAANVASRAMLVLATPKQAGPTSRMPWRRQMPSSSMRAAPLSPAVTTARALTPRCPHCSAIPGTAAAGAATTARSTCSGSAAADGTHRTPFSSATLGLTA